MSNMYETGTSDYNKAKVAVHDGIKNAYASAHDAYDDFSDHMSDIKQDFSEWKDNAHDFMSNLPENASQFGQDAADYASGFASGIASDVKDVAEPYVNAAQDFVDDRKRDITVGGMTVANTMQNKATEITSGIRGSFADVTGSMGSYFTGLSEDAKEQNTEAQIAMDERNAKFAAEAENYYDSDTDEIQTTMEM